MAASWLAWQLTACIAALAYGAQECQQSSLGTTRQAAVYGMKDALELRVGPPEAGAVAWGTFEDNLNSTGWGILNIQTASNVQDGVQYEAAGMVEGYLTAKHIATEYQNALGYVFKDNVSEPAIAFLKKQRSWAWEQVRKAGGSSPFWHQVGAVLRQLQGMEEGYPIQCGLPQLPDWAIMMLTSVGDLFTIMPAVDPHRRANLEAMSVAELKAYKNSKSMCSAIVKVPGAYEDLFMGHSTWNTYAATNRIFKHYYFNQTKPVAAKRVSFSSYPGYMVSLDDFYMMDSGLGMVQTSNPVLNNSVLAAVKPESLLAWQRVRVAHSLAHTGGEWMRVFRNNFSGTYANQYMLVDFNLFSPGHALKDGTLFVVEEMPGLLMGGDQTEKLRLGYWPSYNVPFYDAVYEKSGYSDSRLGKGRAAYELDSRAKIFRRDQGSVVDMPSLKRFLRQANYSDPYAVSGDGKSVDYFAAICARGDFAHPPDYSACQDTKVTSALHGFWNLSAEIVNGPTSIASDGTKGASGNPIFKWPASAKISHIGVPEAYPFDFITTMPNISTPPHEVKQIQV